jgi:hypothetical protein
MGSRHADMFVVSFLYLNSWCPHPALFLLLFLFIFHLLLLENCFCCCAGKYTVYALFFFLHLDFRGWSKGEECRVRFKDGDAIQQPSALNTEHRRTLRATIMYSKDLLPGFSISCRIVKKIGKQYIFPLALSEEHKKGAWPLGQRVCLYTCLLPSTHGPNIYKDTKS